jgi:hypothetical protein
LQSVSEAQAKIEELTGIKRSPTQIREFMKRIGLKRRKIGYIPGKATEPNKIEEQEELKTKELEPRLQEAKQGKRVVFFADAAHFVFGTFLGYIYSFLRLFIPSPSGRKRFNVLGAINAVTNLTMSPLIKIKELERQADLDINSIISHGVRKS